MRGSTITVRVPRAIRRRLEAAARREGRSLSEQVRRVIVAGLEPERASAGSSSRDTGSMASVLAGGRVATYEDFRAVRTLLSASLARRVRVHGRADR
jgi:hypothetical protein